jgi:hypothetical protein
MVNSSLTGPICSRALKQLTQLEILPAREKIGRLMSEIAPVIDSAPNPRAMQQPEN